MSLIRSVVCCAVLVTAALSPAAGRAQKQAEGPSAEDRTYSIHLDPSASQIRFTLRGWLRNVHGSFPLKGGVLAVNPAAGLAQGEILVDAEAGKTGNAALDKRMQTDVLESNRYPAIFFHAEHVRGLLPPGDGAADVIFAGTFNIHGADHPMELRIHVERRGSALTATTRFTVPYVAWGMKDPSTILTHYSKQVLVDAMAKGTVETVRRSE